MIKELTYRINDFEKSNTLTVGVVMSHGNYVNYVAV
jgi:hypothetical protein